MYKIRKLDSRAAQVVNKGGENREELYSTKRQSQVYDVLNGQFVLDGLTD